MKALIFPKHDFPHPTDDAEAVAARKPSLFEDLYRTLRVADPYITGRAPMNALTKVLDKVEAHLDLKEDGPMILSVSARARDEDLELQVEDAEFEVLKQCATLICEQGVNAGTSQTRQTGRIFDTRRAIRLLEFLDAAKAPVVAPKLAAEGAE